MHVSSIQFLLGGSILEILGSHHPHSRVVIELVVAVIKAFLLRVVALWVFDLFVGVEVVFKVEDLVPILQI